MRALFFCLVAGAALLVGCGKPAPPPVVAHPLPAYPRVSQCDTGIHGGQLVLALPAPPRTFNPYLAFDASSDAITRLLFSSFVYFDQVTQEPGPGLAESWVVTPDQKTWTIKLRSGVHWSDGRPLTADDVVFTWNELVLNTNYNRLTFDLFQINGQPFKVSRVDDLTVQVVTPEPFGPFLEFFCVLTILPKHVLQPSVTLEQFLDAYGLSTKPANLVGSGPFRLKSYEPGKSMVLERNPEYWVTDRAGKRLPYLDEVKFLFATEPGGDLMMFINGESQLCENPRPEFYPQFVQASAGGRFKVLDLGPGMERDFMWFNLNSGSDAAGKPFVDPARRAIFSRKEFRQAVACALDRQRIAREVYGGRALPGEGFIGTENPRWQNTAVARYQHDPARSRQLLAELGLSDANGDGYVELPGGADFTVTLLSNTPNPNRERSAKLIVEDLKAVGLKFEVQTVDYRLLIDKITQTFNYECALMGLGGGGVDPAAQINVLRSSGDLHQWFPRQVTPATPWEARIDDLINSLMRTTEYRERKKAFDEIQVIMADELPMIYTISPLAFGALRPDLRNLRPAVLSPYRLTWNLEELYFQSPR